MTIAPGLTLSELHAGYGAAGVLQGVSLHIAPGEVVCLLGRNGAGRSTLLKAVMGLLPLHAGEVFWHDGTQAQALHGQPTHRIARAGLAYVPESRDVFPRLSVRQNLLLGEPVGERARRLAQRRQVAGTGERWPLERLLALFPALATRLDTPAGVLSGGEQQMLALARALRGDPDALLIDEPTEGLAPRLVEQVGELLRELPCQGVAVLLVEQKLTLALEVAQRCCVLGRGRVVFEGPPQALRDAHGVQAEWLAV